ncbi:MAG TPA: DUF3800 domain-containing protein [Chloroflexi bacterium]|nr:DUF3800 domain-containing protein [Chloroflexota bacterium]
MYFFYVDESGTGLRDKRSNFFVLAAFAIEGRDWNRLDEETSALKRRLVSWAKPEDWEIKGRDIRRGDRLFQNTKWENRADAFVDIAEMLRKFPCRMFVVQVNKQLLSPFVETDSDLYRIAFWQMLDEIDRFLGAVSSDGFLMLDMRSDMHSSVQDRRVLDAYREWVGLRFGKTRLVELPWFGFSSFYAGLQLADFTAYLFDFTSNQALRRRRGFPLYEAWEKIKNKVSVVKLP